MNLRDLTLLTCFFGVAYSDSFRPMLDGRIVGGVPVDIVDYPYQLSLFYRLKHLCGASIMTSTWALTAAHCTPYTTLTYYGLRAGSNSSTSGGSMYALASFVRHPKFNSTSMEYDAALLNINGAFQIGTPGIAAIPVTFVEPPAGLGAKVSGWGAIVEGGTAQNNLNAVKLKIFARKQCNTIYTGGITNSMICAYADGKDSCQGDSGGPLVMSINNLDVQVGIVSWGNGCARPNFPGVYTNIASIYSWITKTTA